MQDFWWVSGIAFQGKTQIEDFELFYALIIYWIALQKNLNDKTGF